MLIVLSFATFRASRLRTAIISSELHCEVTKFLVGFQICTLCASTYVNLCELMSTYARYLDVFLAKRSFILYLCGAFNQYYLSIMFITNHYDQNTNQSSAIGRMELPRVISLSFCLALPGKSSRDSYAKIQTSQASLSSVDERFFLQR